MKIFSNFISKKKSIVLLFTILLLGTFLRFYQLGKEDLWKDEAYTWRFVTARENKNVASFSIDVLTGKKLDKVNPPFYYFLETLFVRPIGQTEFNLRLLSVLAGIGSVFLSYLFGKKLFSSSVGLLSAFALSVSVFHIKYSQEARSYSLVVFLLLLVLYLLYLFYQKEKIIYLVAAIITLNCLILTHYIALGILLFSIPFLIFILVTKPHLRKKTIYSLSIFSVSAAWYYKYTLSLIAMTSAGVSFGGGTFFSIDQFFRIFKNFLGKSYIHNKIIFSDFFILSFFVLLPLAIYIYIYIKKPNVRKNYYFVSLVVYALLAFWFFTKAPWYSRYGVILLPIYLLFFIGGLFFFSKLKYLAYIFLIAFTILNLFSLKTYFSSYQKPQWREIYSYLKTIEDKKSVILSSEIMNQSTVLKYYKNYKPQSPFIFIDNENKLSKFKTKYVQKINNQEAESLIIIKDGKISTELIDWCNKIGKLNEGIKISRYKIYKCNFAKLP